MLSPPIMSDNRAPRRPVLAAVRQRIDRLDLQLLRLLNERATLALEIGRMKKRRKWPVFDAKREMFVLHHVLRANAGPLSAQAVRHIFQAILCECRRRERSGKSSSHQARRVSKKTVGQKQKQHSRASTFHRRPPREIE